jgi:peroxiredoxin
VICNHEAPSVEEAHQAHRDSVEIIGVSWAGSDKSMQAFEERHALTFPSLRDDDGSLFAQFGVVSQPAWVFVAADGTAETVQGALGEAALQAHLSALGQQD